MKKLMLVVLSFIVAIGLVGCANPNEITPEKMKTVKFLDEAELKTLFSDAKILGTSYKWKSNFEFDFKSDGTYSGTVANGKKFRSGTWNVNGNMKCMKSNKERCRRHYKDGDKYYTVDGNIITSDFIIKK